jgi:D-lactate dehydrogenase
MRTHEAAGYQGTTLAETLGEAPIRKELQDALDHEFSAEAVKLGEVYRTVYSRDGSYFEYYPEAVVRIFTAGDVQKLLRIGRDHKVPLTFRAGGSSLSGQTVGTGIIADLRLGWKKCELRDDRAKVWFEPGLTVEQVNHFLAPAHRKIGPDPASSQVAMMGGVLSNNSSGMQAGVELNSYHMLASIEFILPNGNRYDTANAEDRIRFAVADKAIHDGLAALRDEVRAKSDLLEKIRRKYRIKNVTGYSINSFVDFDDPIDIFAHLLIGAEGTLAFIVSAELKTLPLDPYNSSALLFFHQITDAAAAVSALAETGPDAIELMDDASLRSVIGKPGVPEIVAKLPAGAAALLVDYQAETSESLQQELATARKRIATFDLIESMPFSTTAQAHADLWAVRNGIFGSVGGARKPGTTVILEDIAAPPERLAELTQGLQAAFAKANYHGVIFGHAKAGNLHFMITDDMSNPARVAHFGHFMDDVVDLVLGLDGSLKAEHGTGRAIAPLVEREWGSDAYSVMTRLKQLIDPDLLLNPNVIITDEPHEHLAHIKSMDLIGDRTVDKCIECGFCEHVCPTRYVTLTPRQRIVSHRVRIALEKTGQHERAATLWDGYAYEGRDTCVADGMCGTVCPVGVNTAYLTDRDREEASPRALDVAMMAAAKGFHLVEDLLRLAIDSGVAIDAIMGDRAMPWITKGIAELLPGFPQWSKHVTKAPHRPHTEPDGAEIVYFPSCVARMMGSSPSGKDGLMETVLRVALRANIGVYLPKNSIGLCCSQIWLHKGFIRGQTMMANRLVEAMWTWSDGGRLPIMCDVTSCARTLLTELEHTMFGAPDPILTPKNRGRYEQLRILDIAEWLHDDVLPKLEVASPKESVVLHPTCACRELGLMEKVLAIGRACAKDAYVPFASTCCGAGGDRGFLYPEITESALRDEAEELKSRTADGAYSSGKTCEIVLSDRLPFQYESIIYLVDETTRPRKPGAQSPTM